MHKQFSYLTQGEVGCLIDLSRDDTTSYLHAAMDIVEELIAAEKGKKKEEEEVNVSEHLSEKKKLAPEDVESIMKLTPEEVESIMAVIGAGEFEKAYNAARASAAAEKKKEKKRVLQTAMLGERKKKQRRGSPLPNPQHVEVCSLAPHNSE